VGADRSPALEPVGQPPARSPRSVVSPSLRRLPSRLPPLPSPRDGSRRERERAGPPPTEAELRQVGRHPRLRPVPWTVCRRSLSCARREGSSTSSRRASSACYRGRARVALKPPRWRSARTPVAPSPSRPASAVRTVTAGPRQAACYARGRCSWLRAVLAAAWRLTPGRPPKIGRPALRRLIADAPLRSGLRRFMRHEKSAR